MRFFVAGFTVFIEIWFLGAGTALLGKEAAMACTVAVEEMIGQHYDRSVLLHYPQFKPFNSINTL